MPTHPSNASSKEKSTAQPQSNGQTSSASQATGEREDVYGLVSFLYHALQGAETYAQYADDARRAGDDEVVEFFEDCQSDDIERSERARELLAARLGLPDENGARDDEADEDDEDEDE